MPHDQEDAARLVFEVKQSQRTADRMAEAAQPVSPPVLEQSRLWFDEDGHLCQSGAVTLSQYLAALEGQLRLFLARLESCDRSQSGDYLLRDARAGSLSGMRVLWDNVVLLAQASTATMLPRLTPDQRDTMNREGVLKIAAGPTRNARPLADALRQLTFSIPYNADGTWVREISSGTVAKIRAIAGELAEHRAAWQRSEGGAMTVVPASADPDAIERAAERAAVKVLERIGAREQVESSDSGNVPRQRTTGSDWRSPSDRSSTLPGGDGVAKAWARGGEYHRDLRDRIARRQRSLRVQAVEAERALSAPLAFIATVTYLARRAFSFRAHLRERFDKYSSRAWLTECGSMFAELDVLLLSARALEPRVCDSSGFLGLRTASHFARDWCSRGEMIGLDHALWFATETHKAVFTLFDEPKGYLRLHRRVEPALLAECLPMLFVARPQLAEPEPSEADVMSLQTRILSERATVLAHEASAGDAEESDARKGQQDADTPLKREPAKLPSLLPWAILAYKAVNMYKKTRTEVALALAKIRTDPKITQPRVSEQVLWVQQWVDQLGLDETIKQACSSGCERPESPMDPYKLDLGKRTDGRAQHIREKARQIAKEG